MHLSFHDCIVVIAKAVIFAIVRFLEAPSNLTSEALELDLHRHTLRNSSWLINVNWSLLEVALALTDHAWLEGLEWPKSALTFSLPDQEAFIEERNLARSHD